MIGFEFNCKLLQTGGVLQQEQYLTQLNGTENLKKNIAIANVAGFNLFRLDLKTREIVCLNDLSILN